MKRRQPDPPTGAPPYRSADERRAEGKALRDAAPRDAHAGWKPPKGRHDPVDIVSRSNVGRLPGLVPIRFGRMSSSPFAFYRGAAALMAADLAHTPTSARNTRRRASWARAASAATAAFSSIFL